MSRNSKNRRKLAAAKAHTASKPGPKQTTPKHGKKNTWYNKLSGDALASQPKKQEPKEEPTEE
jgi:hypothetical protein